MFSLPSFFTFPSISLPANIQRRFLSYVLKRALGRFIRFGLDADKIQAQISEGRIEIEGLVVDEEEINSLIPPSIPLTLTSGTLSRLSARLPFPNLWSDPLNLSLDTLILDFTLTPPDPVSTSAKGKSPSPLRSLRRLPPKLDLASSVTSAADEFLHSELDAYEEAELDRSIRQSLILNRTDPFTAEGDDGDNDLPGAFPSSSSGSKAGGGESPLAATEQSTTVLAGLVERILARLQVEVKDIRIRIHFEDKDHGTILELRIGEIKYAEETPSPAATTASKSASSARDGDGHSAQAAAGRSTRVLRMTGFDFYLIPLPDKPSTSTGPPTRPPYSSYSRSSSMSSTSTTSTEGGEGAAAEMMMSQAVADLRQSVMSSSTVGESVYLSAYSETPGREAEVNPDAAVQESETVSLGRSITPTGGRESSRPDVLLLSLGSEDIVLRMTTTPPLRDDPSTNPVTGGDVGGPAAVINNANVASIELDISIGAITMLLLPSQTVTLLTLAKAAIPDTQAEPHPDIPPETRDKSQPRIDARLHIKGVVISAIYDMEAEGSHVLLEATPVYWVKPLGAYLPVGHVRMRLEGIEAGYTIRGNSARAPASAPIGLKTDRAQPRRVSSTSTVARSRFSSAPIATATATASDGTFTLKINDLSIFEYLASDIRLPRGEEGDAPPGGAYPVLLFDSNLPKQYDIPSSSASKPTFASSRFAPTSPQTSSSNAGSAVFPEFDMVDWRNSGVQKKGSGVGVAGERVWKVRQKGKGVLKGTTPVEAVVEPVLQLRKELSRDAAANIEAQPIHIFLDLSLLERLLAVLRYISSAVRSTRIDKDATPHHSPPRSMHNLSTAGAHPTSRSIGNYVIDDLDAQASSFATLQPGIKATPELATFTSPMIRVDIRCPAPPNRRGSWGDGAHLRSGIVTLDVHGLKLKLFHPAAVQKAPGRISHITTGSGVPKANMEWQKMFLFFSRVPDKRASAFLIIGPLIPDPGEVDAVLLPIVELKTLTTPSTGITTSVLTCRIPNVQAKIRQRTIEGLQFFADDITHWLDGAFGDGSSPKPRDDLKMIGSRFFGSKASSSASSSAEEEDEEDDANAATLLRILVSEADIALYVPRGASTAGVTAEPQERVLSLLASDIDAKVESNTTGRRETAFTIALMDMEFSERSNPTFPTRILGRTTPLTLTTHNSPLVQLRFASLTDLATGTKETIIKAICSSFTFFVSSDHSWVKDLVVFAKTPEGVFEDVVPSEVTRISVQLYDASIHASAPTLQGGLVVVLGGVDIRTDIESESDEKAVEVGLTATHLLLMDDIGVAAPLQSGFQASVDAWKKAGYAPFTELVSLDLQILQDQSNGEVVVDVVNSQVKVTACADSLALLGPLLGDLATLAPSPAKIITDEIGASPADLAKSINVFDSVDENAFNAIIPDIASGADLIEDDLPTNLDYLETATRPTQSVSSDKATGETLRSWQTTGLDNYDDPSGDLAGETVKILMHDTFDMDEQYWDGLPLLSNGYADDTRIGQTRVRVHDCSVIVYLYDGYDFQRTRKAIEDEIKAVRRRLERIRQLLASGQKPDASVEVGRTSSLLFNSVYIGLDQDKGQEIDRDNVNLDSAALLAAIDDELEDLNAETASQSSWQSFPGGNQPTGTEYDRPASGAARHSSKKSKARLHGRRLTRSKRPQIEISLEGIKADLDIYSPDHETASRVHFTVRAMEILDHIKTSTWKKFLTEMKADSRGNVKETDADMVRVELVEVRPSLPSPAKESRLRAKILPLRLHVDQDALDFLKRFFNFTLPATKSTSSATSTDTLDPSTKKKGKADEPFFQHVEIFPIELKLDYKPKWVDYAALREGRTIELMNFFHFDGAEMTLRHITMSGVSGWDRLSTNLQDIWTPDVKANQLADVLTGVSPIRSMVNVGSGVADLILLPIEQYRKDGRVARGVQRGGSSFVKSTAAEMMKLGARLATGTQVILEKAEGVLGGRFGGEIIGEVEDAAAGAGTGAHGDLGEGRRNSLGGSSSEDNEFAPGASASAETGTKKREVSRYANQPSNTREGIQEAYKSLSKNMNSAAQTILAVPLEVYERSGDNGPLRAVVRAVPIAVLKPMIGASEAVSKTLLGMRNSLDPIGRQELGDKYK